MKTNIKFYIVPALFGMLFLVVRQHIHKKDRVHDEIKELIEQSRLNGDTSEVQLAFNKSVHWIEVFRPISNTYFEEDFIIKEFIFSEEKSKVIKVYLKWEDSELELQKVQFTDELIEWVNCVSDQAP